MKIKYKDIISTLDHLKINYEASFNDVNQLTLASLFKPINKGFYFLRGGIKIPDQIQESVFIIDETIKKTDDNYFITVFNIDPQQAYYLILSTLYTKKSNGIISKTSIIHDEAEIGKNVQIDEFCVIGKCTIEDNVIVGSHTKIYDNTIIRANTIIESQSCIGTQGVAWVWDKEQKGRIVQPQLGGVEIDKNCFLGANTIIVRGSANEKTYIGENTLLAPGSRLGHGTQIGKYVHFANNICTGGNTSIGDFSFIGSGVTFRPRTKIHPKTVVGAGALVVKDTSKEGMTLVGVPAKEIKTKENPAGMPKPKL